MNPIKYNYKYLATVIKFPLCTISYNAVVQLMSWRSELYTIAHRIECHLRKMFLLLLAIVNMLQNAIGHITIIIIFF
jgi:hypothetical protein